MERRPLGSSGLQVRPIGLGGMPMSIRGQRDEARSIRVICAALDAGMDFIDTADVYCLDQMDYGHNERLIARALREWKGTTPVVVATKGGLERPGGAWTRNASPEHLRSACEASLVALGVEAIDLYQLHAPDPKVPLVESVGALAELKKAGKVRNIGLSNVSSAQIEEAMTIVEIVSVQNRCSPLATEPFHDGVLSTCERLGLAFLPYSPVGGGRGKFQVGSHPDLIRVGKRLNVSPYQVALAWLLAKSSNMIPIPGASREESAVSSAAAMSVALSAMDLTELDAAFLS